MKTNEQAYNQLSKFIGSWLVMIFGLSVVTVYVLKEDLMNIKLSKTK